MIMVFPRLIWTINQCVWCVKSEGSNNIFTFATHSNHHEELRTLTSSLYQDLSPKSFISKGSTVSIANQEILKEIRVGTVEFPDIAKGNYLRINFDNNFFKIKWNPIIMICHEAFLHDMPAEYHRGMLRQTSLTWQGVAISWYWTHPPMHLILRT